MKKKYLCKYQIASKTCSMAQALLSLRPIQTIGEDAYGSSFDLIVSRADHDAAEVGSMVSVTVELK